MIGVSACVYYNPFLSTGTTIAISLKKPRQLARRVGSAPPSTSVVTKISERRRIDMNFCFFLFCPHEVSLFSTHRADCFLFFFALQRFFGAQPIPQILMNCKKKKSPRIIDSTCQLYHLSLYNRSQQRTYVYNSRLNVLNLAFSLQPLVLRV